MNSTLFETLGNILSKSQPEDFGVIGLLFIFSLSVLIQLFLRSTSVRSEIEKVALYISNGEGVNPPRYFGLYTSVYLGRFVVPGRGSVEVCKTDPVAHMRTQARQDYLRNFWVQMPPFISGLALFFTFLLIGVAVFQIGDSITSQSSDQLKSPIQHLSFKFFVSAFGLLSSIALTMIRNHLAHKIEDHVHIHLSFLLNRIVTREAMDVELQIHQATGAIETVKMLAITNDRLGSLEKLEVKVSDLSQSVLTAVANQITEELGRSINVLLDRQAASLQTISDNLSETLRSSMAGLSSDLQQRFAEISDQLNHKSENSVGDILGKLETMLSGGTKQYGESMTQSLSAFAELLPALQTGLNEMITGLASSTQQNSERSAQERQSFESTLNTSLGKINEIVGALAVSNSENSARLENALTQIESVSRTSVQSASQTIEEASRSARDQLKHQSDEFHQTVAALMAEIKGTTEMAATAASSLQPILLGLQPILSSSESIMTNSRLATDDLKVVSNQLKEVVSQTMQLPLSVAAANHRLNETLATQAQLLGRNQESFKEIGNAVGDGVSSALSLVRSGFETTRKDVQISYQNLNEGVGSKIEDLSETITDLNENLGQLLKSVGNGGR